MKTKLLSQLTRHAWWVKVKNQRGVIFVGRNFSHIHADFFRDYDYKDFLLSSIEIFIIIKSKGCLTPGYLYIGYLESFIPCQIKGVFYSNPHDTKSDLPLVKSVKISILKIN